MDVYALRHRVTRLFVRATCISCCNINNHKKYGTDIISYQLMMQILGQRQNKKLSRKKISYLRPGYVPGQENKRFQRECRMAYYQYIKYNILGETTRMTLGHSEEMLVIHQLQEERQQRSSPNTTGINLYC